MKGMKQGHMAEETEEGIGEAPSGDAVFVEP